MLERYERQLKRATNRGALVLECLYASFPRGHPYGGLLRGRVDAVAATRSHEDAVAATRSHEDAIDASR